MGHPWSHRTNIVTCQKPNQNSAWFSQALPRCRVSVYLHGQRGLNPQLEQSYQDWWCWELPAIILQSNEGVLLGLGDRLRRNKAEACCPRPPIPILWSEKGSAAWFLSWEHHARPHWLLPSNGNSCNGPTVPSAFLYKANSCKERLPLTWTSSLCTQQQWLQSLSQFRHVNMSLGGAC